MAHEHDGPGHQEEGAPAAGGLYIGGSVTGGALATGHSASARDESRHEGPAAPLPPVTARPVSAPAGQTVIAGHVTGGAVATGRDSEAVDASVRTDPLTARALEDLREVRAALAALPATFETETVGGALDEARREIEEGGAVAPGLLQRLLSLVRGGSTVLGEVARSTRAVEDLQSSLMAIEQRHGG